MKQIMSYIKSSSTNTTLFWTIMILSLCLFNLFLGDGGSKDVDLGSFVLSQLLGIVIIGAYCMLFVSVINGVIKYFLTSRLQSDDNAEHYPFLKKMAYVMGIFFNFMFECGLITAIYWFVIGKSVISLGVSFISTDGISMAGSTEVNHLEELCTGSCLIGIGFSLLFISLKSSFSGLINMEGELGDKYLKSIKRLNLSTKEHIQT